MKWLEETIEWIIFQSRWILAPLYLGLVAALLLRLDGHYRDLGCDEAREA